MIFFYSLKQVFIVFLNESSELNVSMEFFPIQNIHFWYIDFFFKTNCQLIWKVP